MSLNDNKKNTNDILSFLSPPYSSSFDETIKEKEKSSPPPPPPPSSMSKNEPSSPPDETPKKLLKAEWTKFHEEILIQRTQEAIGSDWIYKEASKYYKRFDMLLGWPIAVITTITGIINLDQDNVDMTHATGYVLLFATILSATQNVLKLREKAENYTETSKKYKKISTGIECELMLEAPDRSDPNLFIRKIHDKLQLINEEAKEVPNFIISKFVKQFGHINIAKPLTIDQLQNIKVNRLITNRKRRNSQQLTKIINNHRDKHRAATRIMSSWHEHKRRETLKKQLDSAKNGDTIIQIKNDNDQNTVVEINGDLENIGGHKKSDSRAFSPFKEKDMVERKFTFDQNDIDQLKIESDKVSKKEHSENELKIKVQINNDNNKDINNNSDNDVDDLGSDDSDNDNHVHVGSSEFIKFKTLDNILMDNSSGSSPEIDRLESNGDDDEHLDVISMQIQDRLSRRMLQTPRMTKPKHKRDLSFDYELSRFQHRKDISGII